LACSLALMLGEGADAQTTNDSVRSAVNWLGTSCAGPGGTFRVHPGWKYVSGYFGTIISIGLIAAKVRLDLVRDWMTYYVAHAHDSATGIDGVPDDVNILADGSFEDRGGPDSTDAYGATFMMLSRAAYESGDSTLRSFVLSHRSDLLRIGDSSLATQQPNGLTWSKPEHHFAYAADNIQVYRGMLDGAALFEEAFGDRMTAERWRAAANRSQEGIRTYLWDEANLSYRPYVDKDFNGPTADLSEIYPGALAQIMAIVYQVPDVTPQRAASLLSRTYASMSSPLATEKREYRILYDVALARSGHSVRPVAFTPSDICVDAGWYLLLTSLWQP
jgi:hypothetical protein